MNIRLWYIRSTMENGEERTRLYSKMPPERSPLADDMVWVLASIIEHCSKNGNEHMVKLPDWFIEKSNL